MFGIFFYGTDVKLDFGGVQSTLTWLTYFLKKLYLKKAIFQITLSGFKKAKSAKINISLNTFHRKF